MKTIILKPKIGLIVRDPADKKPLPTNGKRVENSSYWTRRILSKEVEIVDNLSKRSEKSKPESKKYEFKKKISGEEGLDKS